LTLLELGNNKKTLNQGVGIRAELGAVRTAPYEKATIIRRKEYGCKENEWDEFPVSMKYLLIFLAISATSLYADTYQGKNGKVAHNRAGTAVQTSNGTAVHARGSSTVRSTNGAYHATGRNGAAVHTNNGTVVHTNNGTAVHTNANWDNAYWRSNRYGYWNGQRGYWNVVNGRHVFVVVNL
jgi:hypothetical protein